MSQPTHNLVVCVYHHGDWFADTIVQTYISDEGLRRINALLDSLWVEAQDSNFSTHTNVEVRKAFTDCIRCGLMTEYVDEFGVKQERKYE